MALASCLRVLWTADECLPIQIVIISILTGYIVTFILLF